MRTNRMVPTFLVTLFVWGCGGTWNKYLPASSELGSPSGYRIARSIIHLHSPYSYDACDSKGVVGGVFNESCYQDLRTALCLNRVDYALLTDHPDSMANQTFSDLALSRSGDTVLTQSGGTIGTQMTCAGSTTTPTLYVGFESNDLMATLMLAHEPIGKNGTGPTATGQYTYAVNSTGIGLLHGPSVDAFVFVPHTESRSLSTLTSASPDGIEVYNLHANLSPTIRSQSLGLRPFGNIMDLLVYWLDPFGEQQPDLALLSVLEVSPVYASLWNQMTASGLKPTAIAGSDAHQNVLAFTTRDGERVDSYRRLLRWFSNHVLVNSLSRAELKAALAAGRSWIAFEGLGSPVGMNYSVTVSGTASPVGSTVTYVANATTLNVALPTLHSTSPQNGPAPQITIRLKKVTGTSGAETTVASSLNAALSYPVPGSGIYRAEVSITSHHLINYLGYQKTRLLKEYPWIITNPIYIQ